MSINDITSDLYDAIGRLEDVHSELSDIEGREEELEEQVESFKNTIRVFMRFFNIPDENDFDIDNYDLAEQISKALEDRRQALEYQPRDSIYRAFALGFAEGRKVSLNFDQNSRVVQTIRNLLKEAEEHEQQKSQPAYSSGLAS